MDRADVEYVRILHLAASTSEAVIVRALDALLGRGAPFDYVAVKAIARPVESEVPHDGGCRMTGYTPELGDRITTLLAEFKLSSAADQMTERFVDAGCDQGLVVLAEVPEVEAQARRERRVDRLRRASRLPPAKTFETLDATRVSPLTCSFRPASSPVATSSSAPTTCSYSAAQGSARVTWRARSDTHSSAPASASCSRPHISSFSSSSSPAATSASPARFAPSTPTTS